MQFGLNLVNDAAFYDKLITDLNAYNEVEKKGSYDELCSSNVFRLMPHQIFLRYYMSPDTPFYNMLIYHSTGLGKTCAAVSIAEAHLKSRTGVGLNKINVILPRSLVNEFKNEIHRIILPSSKVGQVVLEGERQCTGLNYMNYHPNDNERDKIKNLNAMIDSYYNIITYDKFVNQLAQMSDAQIQAEYNFSVFIIDEFHNLRDYDTLTPAEAEEINQNADTADGKSNVDKIRRLETIKRILKNTTRVKLILLSATPMFDNADDIRAVVNLFRLNMKAPEINYKQAKFDKLFNENDNADQLSRDEIAYLKDNLFGAVSYMNNMYSDKMIQPKIHIICSKMSDEHRAHYQNTSMKNTMELRRLSSYIPATNSKTGAVLGGDLLKFGKKYHDLMEHIKREIETKSSGLIFIYTEFIAVVDIIAGMLNAHGMNNFKSSGGNRNSYAIIKGDTSELHRISILNTFNSPDNATGANIKILIGTQVLKEGVSLKNVEFIHIMEPWYNNSRMTQIMGRGVRLCRHIDLYRERGNTLTAVQVYIYLSTLGKTLNSKVVLNDTYSAEFRNTMTFDEFTYMRAKLKERKTNLVSNYLIQLSIDCHANREANKYTGICEVKQTTNKPTALSRFILEPIISEVKNLIRDHILTHQFITHNTAVSLAQSFSRAASTINSTDKDKSIDMAVGFALFDMDYNPLKDNRATYRSLYHVLKSGKQVEGFIKRQSADGGYYIFVPWDNINNMRVYNHEYEKNKGSYGRLLLTPPTQPPDAPIESAELVESAPEPAPKPTKSTKTKNLRQKKQMTDQNEIMYETELIGGFKFYLTTGGVLKVATNTLKSMLTYGTATPSAETMNAIFALDRFKAAANLSTPAKLNWLVSELFKDKVEKLQFKDHTLMKFGPHWTYISKADSSTSRTIATKLIDMKKRDVEALLIMMGYYGTYVHQLATQWEYNPTKIIELFIIPLFRDNSINVNNKINEFNAQNPPRIAVEGGIEIKYNSVFISIPSQTTLADLMQIANISAAKGGGVGITKAVVIDMIHRRLLGEIQ